MRAFAATAGSRVTRDVAPEAVDDLRRRPPRASVAFTNGDAVELLPARARFSGDTYQFGVAAEVAPDLTQREVVLVIDDGPYWFELRGLSVRGLALRFDNGSADGLTWYVIDLRRILSWDYGTLRAE